MFIILDIIELSILGYGISRARDNQELRGRASEN